MLLLLSLRSTIWTLQRTVDGVVSDWDRTWRSRIEVGVGRGEYWYFGSPSLGGGVVGWDSILLCFGGDEFFFGLGICR